MEKISKDRVKATLNSLKSSINLILIELDQDKPNLTEGERDFLNDLYLGLFHINIDLSDIV